MKGGDRTNRLSTAPLVLVAVTVTVTVIVIGIALISDKSNPIASAEAKFADASVSGMTIVPASCESAPPYAHAINECNEMCPPNQYFSPAGWTCLPCPAGQVSVNNVCTSTVPPPPPPPPSPPPDPPTCNTPVEAGFDSYGRLLFAGYLQRYLTAHGNTYCLNNYSGNHYFIPIKTPEELNSFIGAAPGLGVSAQ